MSWAKVDSQLVVGRAPHRVTIYVTRGPRVVLTAGQARDIARRMLEAADFADSGAIPPEQTRPKVKREATTPAGTPKQPPT